MTHHIALLGCGNMGGALLQGWLEGGIDARYTVIKPHDLPEKFKKPGITHLKSANEAVRGADIIVLAVKPQILAEVLVDFKNYVAPDALVISTAAGWTIERLQGFFPASQPVVRTLPNLPAALGKGMTLAVANATISASQKDATNKLLECVGVFEWLQDESLMDTASMISGAGPAFPFYLVEVMAKAGENNGVPSDLALRLARQTVIGAAALLEANPERSAADFRKGVTSPGGVTEAALKILMNGEMQKLFDQAIAAGAKRGGELNK